MAAASNAPADTSHNLFRDAVKEGVSIYQMLVDYREIRQFINRPDHSDFTFTEGESSEEPEAPPKTEPPTPEQPSGDRVEPDARPYLWTDCAINGSRMKSAMKDKGLTFKSLSVAMGVSVAATRFWANGYRNPAEENLTKMTKILGVSSSWLCGSGDRVVGGEGK